MTPQRLTVGISGASGAIYGIRLLQQLRDLPIETHLVMSPAGERTIAYETDLKVAAVRALADHWYANDDVGAAIASGSFRTAGMVVAPCSMRSVAELAAGTTATLLTRAADVVLKEKRPLVLVVRETPLHAGHLRNLATLAELGATIAPPVPAFYARPRNLDDVVDHTIGRVLDIFGIDIGAVERWGEQRQRRRRPGNG